MNLAGADPIDPLVDHDLSILAIADIAAKDAGSVFPPHRLTDTPCRSNLDHNLAASPSVALACLSWRAGW